MRRHPIDSGVCVLQHSLFYNFPAHPADSAILQPINRHLKNVGKKHITPPYERERRPTRPGGVGGSSSSSSSLRTGRQAPRGDTGAHNTNLWARAPLGDPLLQDSTGICRDPFGSRRRAAATSGPGSFLQGLGRQVAESGAVGGVELSPGRGGRGDGVGLGERREDGPRRKELYVEN